jgi:hypothetical protein
MQLPNTLMGFKNFIVVEPFTNSHFHFRVTVKCAKMGLMSQCTWGYVGKIVLLPWTKIAAFSVVVIYSE